MFGLIIVPSIAIRSFFLLFIVLLSFKFQSLFVRISELLGKIVTILQVLLLFYLHYAGI